MDWTKLIAGGALLGFIAGFWSHIKAFLWRFANLFIQRVEINSDQAHNALVSFLVARYRRSGLYDRMFGAWHEYRRDGRYTLVPYETFGCRTMFFWHGWRPFFFRNETEARAATAKEGQQPGGMKIHSTITHIRGMLDVEGLLREACSFNDRLTWDNAHEENERNRFAIHYIPSRSKEEAQMGNHGPAGLPWYHQPLYRLVGHRPGDLGRGPTHQGKALDHLIFPERVKSLIREVELWRNSRDWYRQRGIPWKRGWLLYGPPGTGKTALARAFAQDLNLPIFVFNLAELSNHELMKAWSDMQKSVPCVALWEDFDNVFHGRNNVVRQSGLLSMMMAQPANKEEGEATPARPGGSLLTFDCVLNCLDGVEKADGVFTIITTNDMSKIDPALGQPRSLPDGRTEFISTRPGRLDKAVELGYMETADKKRLGERILGEYPEDLVEVLAFIDRYPDLKETPAQFQERCAQIALARFWREEEMRAAPLKLPNETTPKPDVAAEEATQNASSMP